MPSAPVSDGYHKPGGSGGCAIPGTQTQCGEGGIYETKATQHTSIPMC